MCRTDHVIICDFDNMDIVASALAALNVSLRTANAHTPFVQHATVVAAPARATIATSSDVLRAVSAQRRRNRVHMVRLPRGKFVANVSAYTAAADECGKSDGITASGARVRANHTLACPPSYPFGTRIKIDGMGVYTCEDRGGAIKGNRFDIYMKTKREAFAFGRRHLTAQVLGD